MRADPFILPARQPNNRLDPDLVWVVLDTGKKGAAYGLVVGVAQLRQAERGPIADFVVYIPSEPDQGV